MPLMDVHLPTYQDTSLDSTLIVNKLDIGFVHISIIGVPIGKPKGFDPYQYGGIMIRACCCLSSYVIFKHFLTLGLTINKIVKFIIIGV
jgi:hypothetical protein